MQTTETQTNSNARGIPWLVFAGTFLLHAFVVMAWMPQAQFHKYDSAARGFLDGSIPLTRAPDFSPLYLWIHLVVQRLGWSIDVVTWLQCGATAACAGLLCATAMRRFPAWVGVACAALFALDQGVILHARFHEPEALGMLLRTAFLWLLLRNSSGFSAGIVAGLALLLRPTAGVLAPIFLVHAWLNRTFTARTLLILAGPLCAWMVQGAWMFVTTENWRTPIMNPGTVFFEGNNPLSEGQTSTYPPLMFTVDSMDGLGPDPAHVLYRELAGECETNATVQETNSYWFSHGLAALRHDGWHGAGLVLQKLATALHDRPSHDVISAYVLQDWMRDSLFPFLGAALLSACGLVGLVLAFRREHAAVVLALLVQLGVMMTFYASARQRLSAVPALVLLAGIALHHASLSRRNLALVLVPVAVLFVMLRIPMGVLSDEQHVFLRGAAADQLARTAATLRDEGRSDDALTLTARAMAMAPWQQDELRIGGVDVGNVMLASIVLHAQESSPMPSASERFDMALLELNAGKLDDADAHLRELEEEGRVFNRRARQSSCIAYHRALISLLRSDEKSALAHLERCLAARPSESWALALRHVLTGNADDLTVLNATQGSEDVDFLVGDAALRTGRGAEAEARWSRVAKCFPRSRASVIHLASAMGMAGHVDEGVRTYVEAMQHASEPVMDEQWIVPLFRDWLESAPDDGKRRAITMQVLRQFGRMQEAEALRK